MEKKKYQEHDEGERQCRGEREKLGEEFVEWHLTHTKKTTTQQPIHDALKSMHATE